MNGLFKQLKGEFNNDNLSRFGEITFTASNGALVALLFSDGTSAKDVTTAGEGVTLAFSGNNNNTITATGTGKFYVENKYKITSIVVVSGGYNFKDVEYSPITALYFGENYTGYNLTKLKQLEVLTGITDLTIMNNMFAGQSLGDIANLTGITTFTLEGSGIAATMAQFGAFPNLTKVNATKGMTLTGAIEDFVAKRKSLDVPQESGNVDFFCVGDVTFNGASALAASTIEWSASGNNTVVNWNNGTTTIHVNSDGTWTRIS